MVVMAAKQVKFCTYHDPLYDPVSLALTLARASTYSKEDISLMALFLKKIPDSVLNLLCAQQVPLYLLRL